MKAWIRHLLHIDADDLEPEEIGKRYADCVFLLKQKGYEFDK